MGITSADLTTTSPVARSTVMLTRSKATPYESASTTSLPSTSRLSRECVCPATTTSTASSIWRGLVDDLAGGVVALLEGARVGEHDDRLDALAREARARSG